jgi:hypothetical protein
MRSWPHPPLPNLPPPVARLRRLRLRRTRLGQLQRPHQRRVGRPRLRLRRPGTRVGRCGSTVATTTQLPLQRRRLAGRPIRVPVRVARHAGHGAPVPRGRLLPARRRVRRHSPRGRGRAERGHTFYRCRTRDDRHGVVCPLCRSLTTVTVRLVANDNGGNEEAGLGYAVTGDLAVSPMAERAALLAELGVANPAGQPPCARWSCASGTNRYAIDRLRQSTYLKWSVTLLALALLDYA